MAANSRRPTIEQTLAEVYDRIMARNAAEPPEPDYSGLPMAEIMSGVYDQLNPEDGAVAGPEPPRSELPRSADVSLVADSPATNWVRQRLETRFTDPATPSAWPDQFRAWLEHGYPPAATANAPTMSAADLSRALAPVAPPPPPIPPPFPTPGFDLNRAAAALDRYREVMRQIVRPYERKFGSVPMGLDTSFPRTGPSALGRKSPLPSPPGFERWPPAPLD